MRRKSSRNSKTSTPEKTKSESQKKSRKQSSRRRKRSSSRSSEGSDEPQLDIKDSVHEEDIKTSKVMKPDDDSENIVQSTESLEDNRQEKTVTDQNLVKHTSDFTVKNISRKEDHEDSQEEKEEIEDMEQKKNKGKSKGKHNSNFEQSSNNIEPETENENVQGTHQSPSNDYADNENVVQNVNDTTKFDTELQEDQSENVSTKNAENEDSQKRPLEEGFESEYATSENSLANQAITMEEQVSENQESNKSDIYENEKISYQDNLSKTSINEEKYTTDQETSSINASPGKKDETPRKKSSSEEHEKSDSPPIKKKIALRRSPVTKQNTPNEDTSKVRRLSSSENKTEETKVKKISLKRHTTDESSSNGENVDNKNISISRSLSENAEKKRRLSSLGEDKQPDKEDKAKKTLRTVKLRREVARDNLDDEERKKRIALRRQKWGRSDWLNKLTSSLYKVDVESIKIVCPTLQFLNENEVNLETAPKERKRFESEHKRKVSIDNKSEDSDRPDFEKQTSEDSCGEAKVETNPNIIALNRRISIVDDSASKLRPPPSPAKNPPSDVLFITNLVRPFTIKQLKELLERTGKIKEDGFWTDRIKSKCYVQYESVDEAEATRSALHGVHWPIGNGKKLIIDYATVEDLEKAKNPAPPPAVVPEKLPEKENMEPEKLEVKFKEREREDKRKRDAPVREWDLGKEDSRRRYSRSRSRSRERARKHSRRSYTPETYHKKQRKEEEIPQKLMDDLFLKTKATPSIYWQPLSPEEIATKQQQRLVRMEEHKRRIEETRGRVRDFRRPPFKRR